MRQLLQLLKTYKTYFLVSFFMVIMGLVSLILLDRGAAVLFLDRYHNSSYEKRHKAGETVIDKMPNKKKSSDNVGEYVDYEEIE